MSYRADIMKVGQQLQEQSEVPHWMVASTSTILSIARGERETYGARGRWFARVFGTLGVTVVARCFLQLVAYVVVTLWWLKCRSVEQVHRNTDTLFIGFGAGVERRMVEDLRTEVGKAVAHLDQTDPRSLACVAVPRLGRLWSLCSNEAGQVLAALRGAQSPLIRQHARQWLISIAIRLSNYVFTKAWAEALPAGVTRVVFISPDVPAFAVLGARGSARVELWQHGLHRISIVFPPFRHVRSLNAHEARHIARRLPDADVRTVERAPRARVQHHMPTILIVSANDVGIFRKSDHVHVIRAVCEWARDHGFHVVVRPHPSESTQFWCDYFPELELDQKPSVREALSRLCPLFVFGWGSTALLDSLDTGVIPVLIRSGSEWSLLDMVFPLADSTMCWESNATVLADLALDRQAYRTAVGQLQRIALLETDPELALTQAPILE